MEKQNFIQSDSFLDVIDSVLPHKQIKSNSGNFEADDWTKHIKVLPMLTNASTRTWVILAPHDYYKEVMDFAQSLAKVAQGLSLSLSHPIM